MMIESGREGWHAFVARSSPRHAPVHRLPSDGHRLPWDPAIHCVRVVQGLQGYKPSENADDWLGHGIDFWEYAPKQAWAWAEQRRRTWSPREDVAVLASMIRLGNCFDLLDPDNLDILAGFRREYEGRERRDGRVPRENHNKSKYLDCSIFQLAYAVFQTEGEPVDTSRAVFVPSDERLWSRSGLHRHAHIQLCVRNPECILVRGSSDQPRREPMADPIFKDPDVPMSVKMERARRRQANEPRRVSPTARDGRAYDGGRGRRGRESAASRHEGPPEIPDPSAGSGQETRQAARTSIDLKRVYEKPGSEAWISRAAG